MKPIELKFTTALAAALILAGCHRTANEWTAQRPTAVCTDRQGNRVPDADCDRSGGGGGFASNAFLWYYLGQHSAIPPYGERAYGGTYTRTAGATYFHAPVTTAMSRSAAISRGGFGSSAHSFGGFGE